MTEENNLEIKKKNMIIGIILLVVIISAVFFVFSSGKSSTTGNVINIDNKNLRVAEISLPGMFCKACEYSSKSTFESIPGVVSADVSVETKKGIVVYDSSIITKEKLIEAPLIQSYDGIIVDDENYNPQG